MTVTSSPEHAIEQTVLDAAIAVAAQLPSAGTLTVGVPQGPEQSPTAPEGATTAVCARLMGDVSGDLVLVLSPPIAQALAALPGAGADVASALLPALEAGAAALGRVRLTSERVEDATSALDGLRDKGMYLAVPLLDGATPVATFALQVSLPQPALRAGSLDLLREVALEVTVEIGRTRMTVQELLSLHPGEVVELDRPAGSPADLRVNGALVARGEIVVAGEDFALRVTELIAPVNVPN